MCMADTSTIPSLMPLERRIFSTCGVMWIYSRCCLVLKVRYSVWNFMVAPKRQFKRPCGMHHHDAPFVFQLWQFWQLEQLGRFSFGCGAAAQGSWCPYVLSGLLSLVPPV